MEKKQIFKYGIYLLLSVTLCTIVGCKDKKAKDYNKITPTEIDCESEKKGKMKMPHPYYRIDGIITEVEKIKGTDFSKMKVVSGGNEKEFIYITGSINPEPKKDDSINNEYLILSKGFELEIKSTTTKTSIAADNKTEKIDIISVSNSFDKFAFSLPGKIPNVTAQVTTQSGANDTEATLNIAMKGKKACTLYTPLSLEKKQKIVKSNIFKEDKDNVYIPFVTIGHNTDHVHSGHNTDDVHSGQKTDDSNFVYFSYFKCSNQKYDSLNKCVANGDINRFTGWGFDKTPKIQNGYRIHEFLAKCDPKCQ
ncbi:MAG: hypothetical protein V3V14_01355 [Saprospiraceae bacterium]